MPITSGIGSIGGVGGPQGAHGIPIDHLGAWSSATAYLAGYAVQEAGSSWIAKVNNQNVRPSADDGATWSLVAAKGAKGDTGSTAVEVLDDGVSQGTVTQVDFGANVSVLVSGSRAIVSGAAGSTTTGATAETGRGPIQISTRPMCYNAPSPGKTAAGERVFTRVRANLPFGAGTCWLRVGNHAVPGTGAPTDPRDGALLGSNSGGDKPGPWPIRYRASIEVEVKGGTNYAVPLFVKRADWTGLAADVEPSPEPRLRWALCQPGEFVDFQPAHLGLPPYDANAATGSPTGRIWFRLFAEPGRPPWDNAGGHVPGEYDSTGVMYLHDGVASARSENALRGTSQADLTTATPAIPLNSNSFATAPTVSGGGTGIALLPVGLFQASRPRGTRSAYLKGTVALVGDSIVGGTEGWPYTALAEQFPVVFANRATQSMTDWTNHALDTWFRRQMVAAATHALIQFGTNDLTGTITDADMKARLAVIVGDLELMGIPASRVMVATLPPITFSTDSWTTTVNQSVQITAAGSPVVYSGRGVREAYHRRYNEWLRDASSLGAKAQLGVTTVDTAGAVGVPHPAPVYTGGKPGDTADADGMPLQVWKVVDSSNNPVSGVGLATNSNDGTGLHPGTRGVAIMAAAVTASFFNL